MKFVLKQKFTIISARAIITTYKWMCVHVSMYVCRGRGARNVTCIICNVYAFIDTYVIKNGKRNVINVDYLRNQKIWIINYT